MYVVINFEKRNENQRKLTTKYRISNQAIVSEMPEDLYDDNCVFRVIPSCQHEMQNNIKSIVDKEVLPENVDVDYENFISELESNLEIQKKLMGSELKYGTKFQLYQHSSKRFLCIKPADNHTVTNVFENNYTDSACFQFCFTEYPSSYTHFTFDEC